ncbi:MAG TPA: isopentenyl phosphate kinase [Methanospirillum sp.]|uniref:isopentenyl phosphate kinase n=1 Tax=Methanospirillum sp. TaxID=45200 RepID=UPI002CB0FEF6|nr:isopentenyl phosphate kinase [Methanospirillum sp.]HWQ64657.1 isopentenyl phosphate kinase [Methanospirillum sp.]
MRNRTILKLGGSVITEKSAGSAGAIRYDTLNAIAKSLAMYPDMPLLIVHGAGSFGHPQAKAYHIQEGVTRKNRKGIFETHQAVRELNSAVVDALRSSGIEAVPIHPLHGCEASDGTLIDPVFGHLDRMISLGLVPVIHGDVVMDRIRGACIVSGDQLIRVLAEGLGMDRVGLATDVPGLLERDGSVVRELRRSTAHQVTIGNSGHIDVTGGMEGKIAELLALADHGIRSEMFHVSQVDAFLAGKDHGGTRILPEES